MKTFKNITEWMKSTPSMEDQNKVLNLINKDAYKYIRYDIMKKGGILKKIQKTQEFLTKQGINPDTMFVSKVKEIEKEIEDLKKLLPTPKAKEVKAKVKEETK